MECGDRVVYCAFHGALKFERVSLRGRRQKKKKKETQKASGAVVVESKVACALYVVRTEHPILNSRI